MSNELTTQVYASRWAQAAREELDWIELAQVGLVKDTMARMREMENHIRWAAQTIHQAHHMDHSATWQDCPKNTCDSARQALHIEITPEDEAEAMAKRLLESGMDPEVVEQIKRADIESRG